MYEIEKQIKVMEKTVEEIKYTLKCSVKQAEIKEDIRVLKSVIKRLKDMQYQTEQKELF